MKTFQTFLSEDKRQTKIAELEKRLQSQKASLERAHQEGHATNAIEYHQRAISNMERELNALRNNEKPISYELSKDPKKLKMYRERQAAYQAQERLKASKTS